MKRNLIIFILVIIVTISVFVISLLVGNNIKKDSEVKEIPTSSPVSSSGGIIQRYTSPDNSYYFDYPMDWTIIRVNQDTKILSPNKFLNDESSGSIVSIYTRDSLGYTPEQWQNLHILDYTDKKSEIINGHLTYIASYNASSYSETIYIVAQGKNLNVVQFRYHSEEAGKVKDYSEYRKDVEKIFNSIANSY